MPKYLALFKYSEEGAKGLMKEKAAAREAAGRKAYESVGENSKPSTGSPLANIAASKLLSCPMPRPRPRLRHLLTRRELFQSTGLSSCSQRAS
jgi:hypothetical protein